MRSATPILAALLAATATLAGAAGAEVSVFSECEEAVAARPAEQEAWRCFYDRAFAHGRVGEAERRLLALSETSSSGDGWPLFYVASLRWGEPEAALELLGRAAERFEAAGAGRGAFLARSNRQQLLFKIGRIEEAGAEAARAAEIGAASQEPELHARGRIVLARHLLMVGRDLERAYALLEEVETDLSPSLPYPVHRDCLGYLGQVATDTARHAQARSAYRRLIAAASEAGDRYWEAGAWYGLTRIAIEELTESPTDARLHETRRLARRALAVSREADRPGTESKAHWILGVLSIGAEAERHLEECAALAETPRDRGYCQSALARELARARPEEAERVIAEAMRLAAEAADPYSAAFAWTNRMRVSWATRPLESALRDSWAALDRIETLRDLQEDGSNVQAGLFSTWTDDYSWFAGRLFEEARQSGRLDLLADGFLAAERLRARALTDWLHSTGQASPDSGATFASLAEVQGFLGPRGALLAFQVAPWEDLAGDFAGGSWVVVVTRGSARAFPLPGRTELRRAVDLYSGLFEGRDGAEVRPSATLYRDLLAPALAELPAGVDRLILVPDDALHRLPFGALRPAPDAPPLAATHRLTVAPSATLWLGWRRQAVAGAVLQASAEEDERAPALVLAAPAAPGDLGGSAAAADDRSPDLALSELPPLRHARREGRSVAAALGRGTELAMGARASEALLARPDLGRFGIVHLAAHAVTDEDHPERSAVVLAPPAAGDPAGADGLLRAAEIASLDLGGKLVVLSSCRSAAGTVLRGEGVMSLGRAFFQAGARTVVASLWPVRDDEAAVLFEAFYRHLARGETVAAALQAAQAERRAAGAPASAWAAFVVLGDGDLAPVTPAPPPDPRVRLALLAASAVLTLLLVLAAVSLRRRLAAALALSRPRRQDFPDLAPASRSQR